LLGWLANEARRATAEARAVVRLGEVIGGGQLNVNYGPRFGTSDLRDTREFLPEPKGWKKKLVDWLGVDIFLTVKSVTIYGVGNSFSSGVDELGRYSPKATYVSGLHDSDAALLAELPYLDFLMLEANPIGDQGIRQFRRLTKLQFLNLSNTQITDEATATITQLPDLEYLNVSRTRVSDEFAKSLGTRKKLKLVNLDMTHVTDDAVAQLKRQLPDCEFGD
jgi:hypothetical protein